MKQEKPSRARNRGGQEENLSLLLLKQDEQTKARQEPAVLTWNKQLDWGPAWRGSGRQMFTARLGGLMLLGVELRPLEGTLRCVGQ